MAKNMAVCIGKWIIAGAWLMLTVVTILVFSLILCALSEDRDHRIKSERYAIEHRE
jgi:hypothetical protein